MYIYIKELYLFVYLDLIQIEHICLEEVAMGLIIMLEPPGHEYRSQFGWLLLSVRAQISWQAKSVTIPGHHPSEVGTRFFSNVPLKVL